MIITAGNRWKVLFGVLGIIPKLPAKEKLKILLRPLDSVRYHELTYMLKQIEKIGLSNNAKVLDISSPFVPAYLFASKGHLVLKTDIDQAEEASINPSANLKFELADGTALNYPSDSFDLVYSISVVEHIYQGYIKAIQEMIRVTKPGGLVYVSFPISKNYTEEWLDNKIYSHQGTKDDKAFFQYRFDEEKVTEILNAVNNTTETVSQDIYWERKDGEYSRLMDKLRAKWAISSLTFLKNSIHNFIGGFTLLNSQPGKWDQGKDFGNFHLILRKK